MSHQPTLQELKVSGRFANVLDRGNAKASHDTIVYEDKLCVVAPTLGSIVPNWFLIIPRDYHINFKSFQESEGCNPQDLIDVVMEKLGSQHAEALWFEHGASVAGSSLGCGVDHAHIHLLINSPISADEMIEAAELKTAQEWKRAGATQAYEHVDAFDPYLIAGSAENAAVAQAPSNLPSQFFRKIIAEKVGLSDQWDYKKFPHSLNINKTLAAFPTYGE